MLRWCRCRAQDDRARITADSQRFCIASDGYAANIGSDRARRDVEIGWISTSRPVTGDGPTVPRECHWGPPLAAQKSRGNQAIRARGCAYFG
jgi:hypothetical protein